MELTPLLVSIDDAALMLGLSTRTIANLLASGTLKRIKKGRRTLILRSQVAAFASKSDPKRIRPLSRTESAA
jgi:excisionase family DNA binding protein